MKKTMKWAIMLAAVVMLTVLAGSAMADDRMYTSPSFRLPGSRIEIPAEESAAEMEEPEEVTVEAEAAAAAEPAVKTEEPEEVTAEAEAAEEPAAEAEAAEEPAAEAEESEEVTTEAEAAEEPAAEAEAAEEPAAEAEESEEVTTEAEAVEEPAAEAEKPEEVTAEAEAAEEPAAEAEAEEEPAAEAEAEEEPAAEQVEAGEPIAAETEETAEPAEQPDDYDELAEEPAAGSDAWDTAPATETVPEERQVLVRSSRRDTVTGGEVIELTSQLVGFGEAEVHYQWQVDRNDGAGWVDAEDGNRWKYTFLADRTTVMYNWRLIVTVDE